MADTHEFFRTILPAKIADDEELQEIDAVFQFDIEGAGVWTVTLNEEDPGVKVGPSDEADCVINVSQELWEQVVDNPMLATQYFMMGQLKTTNLGLAIQLQKILG